jgi:hypothetical protein
VSFGPLEFAAGMAAETELTRPSNTLTQSHRLDAILGKSGTKSKDSYESKMSLASRIVKVERTVSAPMSETLGPTRAPNANSRLHSNPNPKQLAPPDRANPTQPNQIQVEDIEMKLDQLIEMYMIDRVALAQKHRASLEMGPRESELAIGPAAGGSAKTSDEPVS